MNNIEVSIDDIVNFNINRLDYIKVLMTLTDGKMILVGGNGGSFSDGEHFVAELTGRFNGIEKPFPAINMCSNGAELTAFGNDYGYHNIYIPYAKAFRDFMPSFLLLSTSGKSANIVTLISEVLDSYENPKIALLTGANDTAFENNKLVNIIHVPSFNVQKIQEVHSVILHKLAGDIKSTISIEKKHE